MPIPGQPITDEDRAAWHAAAKKRMARIDSLPQPIRLLIHEYGWDPVRIFLDLGLTSPRQIEHNIRSVRLWDVGDGILTRRKERSAGSPQG
jgi:hypothetical protein